MTQTLSAPIIESTIATTSFAVENCDGSDQYDWIYILDSPPNQSEGDGFYIFKNQAFSSRVFKNNVFE